MCSNGYRRYDVEQGRGCVASPAASSDACETQQVHFGYERLCKQHPTARVKHPSPRSVSFLSIFPCGIMPKGKLQTRLCHFRVIFRRQLSWKHARHHEPFSVIVPLRFPRRSTEALSQSPEPPPRTQNMPGRTTMICWKHRRVRHGVMNVPARCVVLEFCGEQLKAASYRRYCFVVFKDVSQRHSAAAEQGR